MIFTDKIERRWTRIKRMTTDKRTINYCPRERSGNKERTLKELMVYDFH